MPIILSSDPDCPVLDNGLVRVRYDPGAGFAGGISLPGFRVDAWSGSAYVEQGKMLVQRVGDSTGYCDSWVSAGLVEYTPDRAVLQCVLAYPGDAYSRERVYVTVQRGELGVTFECYPALKSAGTQADVVLQWTPALNAGVPDINQSVLKIDSQGSGASWVPGGAGQAKYAATAGSGGLGRGSGQYPAGFATLGAASFAASENWCAILRCPAAYNVIGPYQTTLVVLQAAGALAKYAGASVTAYGTGTDSYQIVSQSAAGYLQCQVCFSATQPDQVMEAEAMTLGTNWSSFPDSAASGFFQQATPLGSAAKTTQTSDVGALTQPNWPNGFIGTYRIFIRAKASVNATVYALVGGQATPVGDPVTIIGQATPAFTWYDLGELTTNNAALQIHGWCNTAGSLEIDRVEAVLTQDRARGTAIFSGARDQGQAALIDSRMLGAIVAR